MPDKVTFYPMSHFMTVYFTNRDAMESIQCVFPDDTMKEHQGIYEEVHDPELDLWGLKFHSVLVLPVPFLKCVQKQ
jgi:hypothetical protein